MAARNAAFTDDMKTFRDPPSTSTRPADPGVSGIRIACLVAVLTTLTAVGQQYGSGTGGAAAPRRIPGFELPPPPKDPDFPLLPGSVGGLPQESPGDAPAADAESESQVRTSPMRPMTVPPRPATWDQSSEYSALKQTHQRGSGAGRSSPRLPVRGLAIVAALALATGVAGGIAHWLSSRRTDSPPVPIVRGRQAAPRDR